MRRRSLQYALLRAPTHSCRFNRELFVNGSEKSPLIAMAFFSRRPSARVVHDRALFGEPVFAAEYNSQVGKYTADFRPILRYLSSQIDPARHADVLEIGPGPGWIGIRLAQSHPAVRVTGIDISPAFVAVANEN